MSFTRSISRWASVLLLLCLGLAHAHTVITYPGYRGNNLHTNGTVEQANGLGVAYDVKNGSYIYPYGMEWIYPCGGMPRSTNRTKWPVSGGAVAFQPGWFPGHATALIYINLGFGETPPNMSHPVVPPFQIVGPTNNPYPGTVCLPQVPLPTNISVSPGDYATIQLVETAKHGASLFNCVDIEFAEDGDASVETVTRDNCFNSSDISFQYMYTTSSIGSGAAMLQPPKLSAAAVVPLLLAVAFGVYIFQPRHALVVLLLCYFHIASNIIEPSDGAISILKSVIIEFCNAFTSTKINLVNSPHPSLSFSLISTSRGIDHKPHGPVLV
ncbi:hypothetical protein N7537_005817 [Penicillium hordei]|uniref:Copper acquisition factor BIM1-like domain-containing protein n=1 Tax=Penicillium hordei TaxID=40994 RepID=A0AAD6H1E7_9EURO|nr:uncharacterized protein N7537_005817 [Penicillium hordei]KAJ5602861.1 hypothetical protein N7537_005817 [Penicillium hordei]